MKAHKNVDHMPRINTEVDIHNAYCKRIGSGKVGGIDMVRGLLFVSIPLQGVHPFKYSTSHGCWRKAVSLEGRYVFTKVYEYLVY